MEQELMRLNSVEKKAYNQAKRLKIFEIRHNGLELNFADFYYNIESEIDKLDEDKLEKHNKDSMNKSDYLAAIRWLKVNKKLCELAEKRDGE
jgi:chloramphenicol O-acetyltransferase